MRTSIPPRARNSIVWAIDPFETKNAHRSPLARAVKSLSAGLSDEVAPFSVVAPAGSPWPVTMSFAMGRNLEKAGSEAVSRDLKRLGVKAARPPRIEVRERASRHELVEEVIRFAKTSHAELVAVNTRRLLARFPRRLGGFAEALIARSEVPVLAVSPKAKIPPRFKRILFPTDFSRESHRAFRKLLPIAGRLHASITIFNVELPYELPFASPEVAFGLMQAYLADAERSHRQKIQRASARWIEEASTAGVKCRFVTKKGKGSVSENILSASARVKSDLICLMGNRHPRAPALLGGTVREVLGGARTPVLEIHR